MKLNYCMLGLFIVFLMTGCEEKWNDHYNNTSETVDQNVWEAIQANSELSMFVDYVKEMKFDSLFRTDDPYTLFIPSNQAIANFTDTAAFTESMLEYHISQHIIQSTNIQGTRKIQTLGEKFALFMNSEGIYFDDIPIAFESPLYRNGKYFIINQVGHRRPSIYEFYLENNPILARYITALDSIAVDLERSTPIGFDDDGNTIYDTVAIVYNEFEDNFFPVRKEFRNRTATVVFPIEEDYNQALTEMALQLGNYQDYTDIPLEWQNEKLIPYLLEQGVFENMLEEIVFSTPTNRDTVKLKNILGDSIVIDYQVHGKVIASNGYAYNYRNFRVPDTLFLGVSNFEAEHLLRQTGANRYAWRESVRVVSDIAIPPLRTFVLNASNDSILNVSFPTNYTGSYSVEFTIPEIFPRKYRMIIGTNMYYGGIYEIYVNDELVRTFDYSEYLANRGLIWNVDRTRRYIPQGSLNRFDALVDNRAEYGETRFKMKYIGPSASSLINRGLSIDNIQFVPYDF